MGRQYFPFVIHTRNRNGMNKRLVMIEKVIGDREREIDEGMSAAGKLSSLLFTVLCCSW